jgi:hypothetical protein
MGVFSMLNRRITPRAMVLVAVVMTALPVADAGMATAAGAASSGTPAVTCASVPPVESTIFSPGTTETVPLIGLAARPDCRGYWGLGTLGKPPGVGTVLHFGTEPFTVGAGDIANPVGITTGFDGTFWVAQTTGGVTGPRGTATYGSMAGKTLDSPIVGIASTPGGTGYWLVAADGGVFSFGDAQFYGSLPSIGVQPNEPVAGIAATPDGKGYWLMAADGGVFSFGDAQFYGSMAGRHLNAPMVGITATTTEQGYVLLARDGGVFTFGGAGFYGSLVTTTPTEAPALAIAETPDDGGYWVTGARGSLQTFGDAPNLGSGIGR